MVVANLFLLLVGQLFRLQIIEGPRYAGQAEQNRIRRTFTQTLRGVIYDRAHTRGIDEFGGLMNTMPRYAAVMTIAFFAALGLPGLSGFISEALSLLGAFQTFRTLTIIGAVTIVLTAGYMLWVLQRVFLGTLPEKWQGLTDMNGRETFMLATLAVIVIFLGIYPAPMLDLMNVSMSSLAGILHQAGAPAMMGLQ